MARVEKTLRDIAHIKNVSVNLALNQANVEYSENQSNPRQEIEQSLKNAGYEAVFPQEEKNKEPIQEEQEYSLKTFLISSALTLPLVLPMLFMPFGLHIELPWYLQLILTIPVLYFFGAGFHKRAFTAMKNLHGTMDVLVSLGTNAAFVLSFYNLYMSGFAPKTHLYFESSAVIITLIILGKFFEDRAKKKTSEAILAFYDLTPKMAFKKCCSSIKEIPVEDVKTGFTLIVKTGESIPVDGVITKGNVFIDESMVTGESLPVERKEGDTVIAGTINTNGYMEFKATAVGGDTKLAKLVKLVEKMQSEKLPIQKIVDRASSVFVPVVITFSIATFFFNLWVSEIGWEAAILRSVAVLVIACPCALGLATPTAIMVGTGKAAKAGILIKDPESLELAAKLQTIAFDKTGTLTEGKPVVKHFKSINADKKYVLNIAYTLQKGIEHPLANATLNYVVAQLATPVETEAKNYKVYPGMGVSGFIDGKEYFLGSEKFISTVSVIDEEVKQIICCHHGSISFLASHDKVIGVFIFEDKIKDNSEKTITKLKNLGVKPILITGDNKATAQKVASNLGIETVHYNSLPEEKLSILSKEKSEGNTVAMVGDGINDAPALAKADVGFALSTGTEVAMGTAGITLMNGDPLLVPKAIHLSQKTTSKIKQNLFWASIYNVLAIPLAMTGMLNPSLAGAAMALSSVSVVLSSLLIK